jgi:hypothetical protein
LHCSHECFLHSQGTTECSCETPFLHAKLDSSVYYQHIHCHLDSGNWRWMGWLGKCHNFQGSSQNFWCICTMLSVPTKSRSSYPSQPKHHDPPVKTLEGSILQSCMSFSGSPLCNVLL